MTVLLCMALVAGFSVLLVFAVNLLVMAVLAHRHRPPIVAPLPPEDRLPAVCVQIPAYNERHVIRRAITAAAALDWPADRLSIQILDDSTDDTTAIARAEVERLAADGVDIRLIRRGDRTGYKAGALAHGLTLTGAPFVAVLDADFVPSPDFLRACMAMLLADGRLAFVQTRWGHLNARANLLTRLQALLLDAHFRIEQSARAAAGLILPFNGTGGVWRRAAIEAAGGWEHDTLTEDLDLAVRAHLAGWRGAWRPDVVVPGELPETLTAWRTQQFRWAKGFAQCTRKLLPRLWAGDLPTGRKLAATLMMANGAVWPATVLVILTSLTLAAAELTPPVAVALFGMAAGGLGLLATGTALVAGRDRAADPLAARTLLLLPAVIGLNAGLLLSNTRAVFEGLAGRSSAFVRTPKRGGAAACAYRTGDDSGFPELATVGAATALLAGNAGWYSPLLLLSLAGLGASGVALALERLRRPAAP
ncbi:glycosyltransferase [Azospirillum sp. RWY-5-1]|uniref:Glycosyltransferase n=1 Tax=Azospirillum oleiclasticum TaxID=2735135 RepID=A0ABX2TC64_9PROT|nr:glycosyltransferase [Azospirillum oleiclasticum]NYZ16901.1 glycosyltransferase [Azospirillum oleiclasticum]NYZ21838.1 glycosyltransferase [Azospirillum oleiclasticum]